MRILVDADGVIANWGDEWDRHAAERLHLGLKLTKDQKDFNLRKGLDDAGARAVQEIMDRPDFYRVLKPMEGAQEALHRLAKEHEVFIVTAPWISNPTCASDKIEWVKQHIGPEWGERVVIAKDKSIVSGDILIDDRPDVLNAHRANWTQVFYTQPYNAHMKGPRIHSWVGDEWLEVIERVENEVYAW